jgi:hypothetical protein
MSTDMFGHLFNSPLEAGIRAVAVLEELRPNQVDLAEMVLFDHLVVHTADIDGPPSLHPDLPGRQGELLVRRRLVEASLELMRRCHLVERESTPDGIYYRASQEASAYLDLLESPYSVELKACAHWLANQVKERTKERFKAFARERIGQWNDAFSTLGSNSRDA